MQVWAEMILQKCFAVEQFVIIFLFDIQVGYEFRTLHSMTSYTLVDDYTIRKFTEITEVKRKNGPVELLEAATAPCWAESSHSVERLSSKSSCKQSIINFPKGDTCQDRPGKKRRTRSSETPTGEGEQPPKPSTMKINHNKR